MAKQSVVVPDLGDFSDVEVIEVLVNAGDLIAKDDPVVTLETDKASMAIPGSWEGVVSRLLVKVGDTVSAGDALLELDTGGAAAGTKEPGEPVPASEEAGGSETEAPAAAARESGAQKVPAAREVAGVPSPAADPHTCDVVVLGSGPGGYTAAFRAADLGLKVVLIERYPSLGGVCLNVGCIPSKALLHAAKVIDEAADFAGHGIRFTDVQVDPEKLSAWKDSVVGKLTGGLAVLARQRAVTIVAGRGQFADAQHIDVTDSAGKTRRIAFTHCIVAVGSKPVELPFLPADERIMDSTDALALSAVPERMLILGGGIIGLEMATIYHALGCKISVVEMLDGLIAGADRDIVKPLHRRIARRYENIWLSTQVTAVQAQKRGLEVTFAGDGAPDGKRTFDRILAAVGRSPNGGTIAAEKAGLNVDGRGFIHVDTQQRTNVPHIYAIGDVTGQPMLAHKAVHEGKVAAEACAGLRSAFDARGIPSVAYTDPEVAWVGVTESEAKEQGLNYGKGVFPWAASGRALSVGRDEGITKLLFDEQTHRIIGGGIIGTNAGELIAEVALAIENNCEAADIGLTIHPHPTLSETVAMSAEAFEGTLTDLYLPKRKLP